ncbi:MAG: hypothetical protein Q8Q04_02915 [archaeon]|nr:hypothetical protein [archaeon]
MEGDYNCLHQVSDHGVTLPRFLLNQIGMGDCKTCIYDPINNPNCAGYSPIKVFKYVAMVKENLEEISSSEKEEKIKEFKIEFAG